MSNPLAVHNAYRFCFDGNHNREFLINKQRHVMIPNELSARHANIVNNLRSDSLSAFSNPITDPTMSQAPVVSSVWLEQGEYYFDDEFSVPFETSLQEDLPEGVGDPDQTGTRICDPLNLDQSCADSCICTPGDSAESAQHERLLSSQQYSKQPAEVAGPGFEQRVNHISRKSDIPNHTNPHCVNESYSSNELDVNENGMSNHSNCPNPNSVVGSHLSGHSGSTSWMEMMMERSCNPDLKALLTRVAAAVDYKLAYGEAPQLDSSDSSVPRQLVQERAEDYSHPNFYGLSRSLSQGNLLSAASLAGLRHALDQATKLLPRANPLDPVDKLGILNASAELSLKVDSGGTCSNSNSAKASASKTTTWAQRHSSRESLKRKHLRDKESGVMTGAAAPTTQKDYPNQTDNCPDTPWRAMKQASGTLITWNQLKRTLKNKQPFGKVATLRESRREQHGRMKNDNPEEHGIGRADDPNVTSDTQLLEFYARTSARSRSQPVSTNHYMHRFSGTLLEIFMRAKAEEMAFPGQHSDESVVKDCAVSSDGLLPTVEQRRIMKFDPTYRPVVFNGQRRSVGCGVDATHMVAEAEKHPLLRGERILPQRLRPSDFSISPVSMDDPPKRHFGVQFPSTNVPSQTTTTPCATGPTPLRCSSPVWSAGIPARRTNVTTGPLTYPSFRHSHPRNTLISTARPQSFGTIRPAGQLPTSSDSKSSSVSPEFAACLTASAGPDSPYLAALRADYVADGYSAGWLGNPRASIAYPGLGLLSIPRPSRLTSAAFLSHTLPDLSFLGQAGAEEERKGTPTMPKRMAACRCHSQPANEHCCAKHGCHSFSVGRSVPRCLRSRTCSAGKSRRPRLKAYTFSPDAVDLRPMPGTTRPPCQAVRKLSSAPSATIPDLVAGHFNASRPDSESDSCNLSSNRQHKSLLPSALHQSACKGNRSTSEPDLTSALFNSTSPVMSKSTADPSYERQNALMSSSSQAYYGWDSNKTSDLFDPHYRPKKSVSFSGQIRQLGLPTGTDKCKDSPASPEPRVIPRNWGLYGQETPLAEFNPRCSPGRNTNQGGEVTRQSDVDVRYHAMVNDVIKAVQETVAYYSTANGTQTETMPNGSTASDPLPYSAVAALGSAGRQPLLAVVGPLTVLLCDGLLPPAKPIFMSKPRTRLWQMVEESCRSGPLVTGVTYRVLSDAVTQVKAITSVTLEKAKFKAFICACLNAKALPMWLNVVVANDALLGRYYCEDAFVRQCRSTLRGLYADLLTHLEQLLTYPFNLDLTVEARKPLLDPHTSSSKPLGSSAHITTVSPVTSLASQTSLPFKTTSRSNVPPAVVMTRKTQPPSTTTVGASATRPRNSPPLYTTAVGNSPSNVHHYPQHHLPGQRIVTTKSAPARTTRSSTLPVDDSTASGTSTSADAKTSDFRYSVQRPSHPSQIPPLTTPASSQVRGRLKTALSSFRRTPVQISVPVSSGKPIVTEKLLPTSTSTTTTTITTTSPTNIPMTDSLGRLVTRTSDLPTPRRAPVSTSANHSRESKLKQPTTVIGPR
ncbi:RUN and SH3 domain-containing protein 1 [Paragonimus heterotremus]|uniref:RUN and SH3 domain-containing protein 1 n=1 Tax=Paragonimus heterotremus TaxID=100268 RepID=A0A8J4TH62_9TREM|nr:RUN and SH3 domain-containing protein 1 [Paragonimus heterotremus]